DDASAAGPRARERLRVHREVEQIARAAVGPQIEPRQRRVVERLGLRGPRMPFDHAARVALEEGAIHGRVVELTVALAEVVRTGLRVRDAIQTVVVERLAFVPAMVALGTRRVELGMP